MPGDSKPEQLCSIYDVILDGMKYPGDHSIPQSIEQGCPTHDQEGLCSKLHTHEGIQRLDPTYEGFGAEGLKKAFQQWIHEENKLEPREMPTKEKFSAYSAKRKFGHAFSYNLDDMAKRHAWRRVPPERKRLSHENFSSTLLLFMQISYKESLSKIGLRRSIFQES